MSVELRPSKIELEISSLFYLFHPKIAKIPRPDMMSLTSAECKSKVAQRKQKWQNISAPVIELCLQKSLEGHKIELHDYVSAEDCLGTVMGPTVA